MLHTTMPSLHQPAIRHVSKRQVAGNVCSCVDCFCVLAPEPLYKAIGLSTNVPCSAFKDLSTFGYQPQVVVVSLELWSYIENSNVFVLRNFFRNSNRFVVYNRMILTQKALKM